MDELDKEPVIEMLPVANLMWNMFTASGYPGFYMLYKDLSEEERSPLD